MPKRIIAVFQDAELLQANTAALGRAGYEVRNAFNLAELKGHLVHGGCDIVVIGPTIPAPEKLRIATFVAQAQADCLLIEIFNSSPDLPNASVHVRQEGGAIALLNAVAHL